MILAYSHCCDCWEEAVGMISEANVGGVAHTIHSPQGRTSYVLYEYTSDAIQSSLDPRPSGGLVRPSLRWVLRGPSQ